MSPGQVMTPAKDKAPSSSRVLPQRRRRREILRRRPTHSHRLPHARRFSSSGCGRAQHQQTLTSVLGEWPSRTTSSRTQHKGRETLWLPRRTGQEVAPPRRRYQRGCEDEDEDEKTLSQEPIVLSRASICLVLNYFISPKKYRLLVGPRKKKEPKGYRQFF